MLRVSVGALEGQTENAPPLTVSPAPASHLCMQTAAALQRSIACTVWHFSPRGFRETSWPLAKRHELGFHPRWSVFCHSAPAQRRRRRLVLYHILYSSCTMDNECMPVGPRERGGFSAVAGALSSAPPPLWNCTTGVRTHCEAAAKLDGGRAGDGRRKHVPLRGRSHLRVSLSFSLCLSPSSSPPRTPPFRCGLVNFSAVLRPRPVAFYLDFLFFFFPP